MLCTGVGRGGKAFRSIVLAATLGLLTGCSSVYMKGTPLYTGEYSKPQGPVESRVNLWPIAYYHDPALSLLWPLGSFTDDHFAIRPVFTIYKLDKPDHEYNVLWPIVQFDFDTRQHRVFPIFWWGDSEGWKKYFVAFPIFWSWGPRDGSHFDTTAVFPLFWYKKDSYVALFPLYMRFNENKGASTHLLWPIFNRKTGDGSTGWRVWPFCGSYAGPGGAPPSYQFLLWPLLNQWQLGDARMRLAIPLYFSRREGDKGLDLLLPFYLRTRGLDSRLILTPFFGRSASANSSFWMLPWLLTWHTYEAAPTANGDAEPRTGAQPFRGNRDFWGLAGLIHSGRSADGVKPERRNSYVIPFYYSDSSAGLFLSVPYCRNVKGNEGFVGIVLPLYMRGWSGDDSWRLIFPLLYQRRAGEDRTFVTPLLACHRTAEKDMWILSPLASWVMRRGSEREAWFLGPVARAKWGGEYASSHVFPLYYYNGGKRVLVTPLFWYSDWGRPGRLLISPLYMSKWNAENNGWSVIPPIYFAQRNGDRRLFISPLVARKETPTHRTWVAPPLLSWVRSSENRRDWWLLAGLAHARSDPNKGAQSHLIPLYFRDAASGTFLTPLFGWTGAGTKSAGATYIGGPLFVYAWNKSNEGRWFLPFPFISGSSTAKEKGYWIWPLYSYNRQKADAGGRHGYAAWPLFWYSLKPDNRKLGLFPVFYSGYEKWSYRPLGGPGVERVGERRRFLSLPIFWYWKDVVTETPLDVFDAVPTVHRTVDTGFWPLWHKTVDETEARRDHDFSIIGWLYDYRSRRHSASEEKAGAEQGATQATQGGGAQDYVRSRILWRFMHYERLNGQSSLDLFPFITYDKRNETKFRKFSFIWRLVRYERTDEGGLKLDLLFIPLHRP